MPAPIFLCLSISNSSCNWPQLPICPYFSSFPGFSSKSRQVWPCGMEPIISKLLHRLCNKQELPSSYIVGWSHSHPPGSKHGHSCFTYIWNQLKVIGMLLTILEVICKAVAMQNSSQWPCSMCTILQLRLVGVRTSYIFFSNVSWTPWVLDPITYSLFGPPPLGCTLLHYNIQDLWENLSKSLYLFVPQFPHL